MNREELDEVLFKVDAVESSACQAELITARRLRSGKEEMLIKWKNYSSVQIISFVLARPHLVVNCAIGL